jgi:spore coat protein H
MSDRRSALGANAWLFLFLVLPAALDGQTLQAEGGWIYDDAELTRIDITLTETALEALYADPFSDVEQKAGFTFTRGQQSESLADVGIRFRGNTSRYKEKKTFRVSFNTFVPGRKFHGIEKMNLNAETNDPSMVRSKLSWELFSYLGVPGARSNHVLLYINNSFYGVYINTEHIDEEFTRSRFGNNDGNLYKCLWPADLGYLGLDQDAYKFEHEGRRAYALTINEKWDDYQDLADLIATLEQESGAQFMEELEKCMNVQRYLKVMAVDVMTGNWDGYIGNQNNYYLYRDPLTGRFEYVAYDLDNTFGIDWLGEDWSDRSIYQWHREERPLYEKILEQDRYKLQYTAYIKKLAAFMSSAGLRQEVERWRSQIRPWVSQDPYYPLDWGYSMADFDHALDSGRGGHLCYGVFEYALLRVTSALEECIQADAAPLVSYARVTPSPGRIRIDWSVENDSAGFTTRLHYHINQGDWLSREQAGAAFTDPESGILNFADSLEDLGEADQVELYLTARDQGGQETRYPAATLSVSFPLPGGPLLINEFMASNSSAVADEYGEYDDWVEIYNPAPQGIWLGDLFLSDDAGKPGKYRFPASTIGPDSYFVVWLDGQVEQGAKHAPFKISRDGEHLRLSRRPAEGFAVMDSLSFGPQQSDVAMGRTTDGGSDWMAFAQPTPGFSNLSTGKEEFQAERTGLILYPNPVTGDILYFSHPVSGRIFSATGREMLRIEEALQADVGALDPGFYLLYPDEGQVLRFVVARH